MTMLTLLAAATLLDAGLQAKFAESYRHASVIQRGGDGNSRWQSQSEARTSTLSLSAEMPLGETKPDADTSFRLEIGNFTFQGKPGDDPRYRKGATTAVLRNTEDTGYTGVRFVVAKAILRWSGRRLKVDLTGNARNEYVRVASAFEDGNQGAFEGTATLKMAFGDASATTEIPFVGVHTKSAHVAPYGADTQEEESNLVEIKGDTKDF